MWIPYIVAQVMANGFLTAGNYKDPTPRPVPDWGKRANRAHINAVESFAPFAALVLIVHTTDSATTMTAIWAGLYFWARLAHAAAYLIGIPFVRTPIFTISFVAIAGLFWEVIT